MSRKNCLLVPRAHSPADRANVATDAEHFSEPDSASDPERPPAGTVHTLFARDARYHPDAFPGFAAAATELKRARHADAADAQAAADAAHVSASDAAFFKFFRAWRRIDARGDSVVVRRAPRRTGPELVAEFHALSGPMRYYWTHMFELFSLFTRQQIPQLPPPENKLAVKARRDKLLLAFYYLGEPQQRLLVDDWIAARTARAASKRAHELETCLARRALAKIKADMLAVVHNIDFVLRENVPPHRWQGAFEGI